MLLDRLGVVVGVSRGLAEVQRMLEHDFLRRIEEKRELVELARDAYG